ncbi:uncharacterized protein LOC113796354 isoform X1 [Dermatophagoides pteronyssinus]|uniref:uncharacterized protein LOC113796354 isoform X1 n=1 Tax=Dermatophagoides pteronyssinus TaxID=6956 RepID=UPI003F664E12
MSFDGDDHTRKKISSAQKPEKMILIMDNKMLIILFVTAILMLINQKQCLADENINGGPPRQIPAAIESYHQIRYIEVPSRKHGPKEPQIHTVSTNSLPMKLLFRSTSSRLQIDQQDNHIPGIIRPMMSQNQYYYSQPPSIMPPTQQLSPSMPTSLPTIASIISPTIIPTMLPQSSYPIPSITSSSEQMIPLVSTTGQFFQSQQQSPSSMTYPNGVANYQQGKQFLMPIMNIYPMMPVHHYGNSLHGAHHHHYPHHHNQHQPLPVSGHYLLPINYHNHYRSTNTFDGPFWNSFG